MDDSIGSGSFQNKELDERAGNSIGKGIKIFSIPDETIRKSLRESALE